jgi:ABC-type microcin C transport system permease subunit YejE
MRANKQGTWSIAVFVVILTGSLCARLFVGRPLEERLSEIEAFVAKERQVAK